MNILRSAVAHFKALSSVRLLLIGYCTIILIGALLLSLPFASREPTPFADAFFTATSATCVTGLIRFDTYAHWTLFGQLVILLLIQIGGIGFMTCAVSAISFTRQKIGLAPRVLMQEAIAAPQVGGIVRMTKFILFGSLAVEGLGAALLCFHFCPQFGFWKGLYFSVFHSVSAFCNAGFDLMGGRAAFSSLTGDVGNWYMNCIVMALIVIGGLGFFVWRDLISSRFAFPRLRLHTKLVLSVSAALIIGGAALIFLFEYGGRAFSGLSVSEEILSSLFQSVSTRTAGFNTLELSKLAEPTVFLMICLMLVGGSTGSTAGGMKTTTLAVMLISITSTFRRRKSVEAFGRRMEDTILHTAACIFMMYLLLSAVSAMLIAWLENLPLLTALFECVSAIATVGLSLGVTPELGLISELILALLMLFGRVGSLTMLMAFAGDKTGGASKLPLEKIQLG